MNEEIKKPVVPARVAEINAQVAASPLTSQGISQAPSAITSSNLQGAKPLTIPTTPTSTAAEGLATIATSVGEQTKAANQLAQEQEQKRLEAESKTNESRSNYQKVVEGITGVFGSRSQLETDAQLGEKAQKVTDVTNQIEALDRAQTNELRALDGKNITEQQKASFASDINRNYAFQKADLALIQSAANRDLSTAQSIVDRKIQLQLEPLKFQLDFVKDFYDENKADLSKEDEKAFNLKTKELDRQYEEAKSLQENIGKLQLEAAKNGAPASVISAIGKSKDYNEAISNAGTYTVAPTSISTEIVEVNGKKLLVNKKTGETIREFGADTPVNDIQMVQAQSDIQSITDLANDVNIRSAVGPSFLGRLTGRGIDSLTGGRQNFIAGIEQLRSQLNLDTLIKAKGQGATFGALSDQELKVLSSAGTKLGTWVMKDGDGNITGYNAGEKDFKKELDKINNFARLDYIRKGGAPEDVGAELMTDGNYYVKNSDGTYTQITTY